MLLGTLSTLVMLPSAVTLGVSAGYFKGWVDDVVQYLYTTISSIPGILLIAASVLGLLLREFFGGQGIYGLVIGGALMILAGFTTLMVDKEAEPQSAA